MGIDSVNRVTRRLTQLLLVACVAMSLSPASWSTEVATKPVTAEQPVTLELLEDARRAVELDDAMEPAKKEKALELLGQAEGWFQKVVGVRAELSQLEARLRNAPGRIEAIRGGGASARQDGKEVEKVIASANLDRIEPLLSREQMALQQARDNQRKFADELEGLLVGSKELNEGIASRTKIIDEIEGELNSPGADQHPAVVQARNLLLKSRRLLRRTEIELLKLRLGNQDLLTNLAQAERDLAAAEVADRQERFDRLNRAAQSLRETRAREAREEAEALISHGVGQPPALRRIAELNAGYRSELEGLLKRELSVANQLQDARLGVDEMKRDFDRTRQRVEVVGSSEAIGKMLKRRRRELPSLQSYRRASAAHGIEINRVTDRQIEIDELLREQGNLVVLVDMALESIPAAEREGFRSQAENLVEARRSALNELQKIYGRYIGQITALDLAERQLAETALTYIAFIDDRMIWIPGTDLVGLLDPVAFGIGVQWLLSPANWQLLLDDAWTLVRTRTLPVVALVSLFLLLLWKQRYGLQRIQALGQYTRRIRTDSFRYTLHALAYTLAAVAPWPLLMVGIGTLFERLPTASTYTLALASGLIRGGLILGGIRLFIQLCQPDGVGERHLHWAQPLREAAVRKFTWLLPIAVPLGFFMTLAISGEQPAEVQLLGQLAFIALMILLTGLFYRLLRRRGAVLQYLRGSKSGSGPLVQLHILWFPLLLLLPLSFAALSAFGYHYAALYLELRVVETVILFVILNLVKDLLLRWLYIPERRLRLEDALRRRQELRAQRNPTEEAPVEEEGSLGIAEVNFDQLSEQSRRLVRAGFLFGAVVGIWSIWSDLLPALSFLHTAELPFHATRAVDGVMKEVPVTLGDLVVGLMVVVITVLAAKNIPGLLEISLLQKLPLDPGARYAITSLSQYTIAGIGVFAAFSAIGLEWSNIQWLVAALGVGLGFGLQEIVANFISGIILLFERPIRVGDVVTIDNISGKVSRIRIRATTIINWDKQELLIPNKEFITGRVINWTLTDKINRIIITVGIAYGDDVDQAMALMLEAARENPNVLADPEPVASFEAFGDNALTLLLRSYLDSIDERIPTITALHRAINEKFNDAGICIAFPQRDLHLSTSRPLDINIRRAPRERGA